MPGIEPLSLLMQRRDEFVAFLRRRVSTPADAEDVLHQALLKAARPEALRDEAALVPWFYRVLRTTLTDHLRAQARAARPLETLEPHAAHPPHEVGNCSCSLARLAELPAPYAEILTRVDIQDEPLSAVAVELGLTSNNATVRLHRARKALRDRLASCCGCTSAEECQRCGCASGCA